MTLKSEFIISSSLSFFSFFKFQIVRHLKLGYIIFCVAHTSGVNRLTKPQRSQKSASAYKYKGINIIGRRKRVYVIHLTNLANYHHRLHCGRARVSLVTSICKKGNVMFLSWFAYRTANCTYFQSDIYVLI